MNILHLELNFKKKDFVIQTSQHDYAVLKEKHDILTLDLAEENQAL